MKIVELYDAHVNIINAVRVGTYKKKRLTDVSTFFFFFFNEIRSMNYPLK